MHLVQAQVHSFKSVTDSGLIDIDPEVTALVGKNESGKTAILQAMYRANALPSGHPTTFDELRDYPRRFRARDRAKIADVSPVVLTFALDDVERTKFEEEFGSGTLRGDTVTVSRRYGSAKVFVDSFYDSAAMVREQIVNAGLTPDKYAKPTFDETLAALEASTAAGATALAGQLKNADPRVSARKWVVQRLPKFQYFDEYNMLPGAASITRLQTVAEDDLEPGERTALALLRLAGVDEAEFTETEYESRKAALEAAANQLTDELFAYWTQNDNLSVELDIEFRPRAGNHPPEPWLQIRVRNQRHRVTLNMAERSKGFVWFFSFLAAFSEFANEDGRVILLDEPGLNLHAKAQNDLLRFIDERLTAKHQVIYSTHSLFMVEPTKLDRCRTVEDLDGDGTKVSRDVWAARPDTVFPLLGALGVDMTQTLIIGADQLLVEGPADVAYLSVMSDLLRREGGRGLDPRWTLTPVGGIDKLPTFVALLGGSDLKIAVLMDGAAGGNQKLTNLVARGLLDRTRLIPITDITGTNEADIEDLFDADWYLGLLTKSGVGTFDQIKSNGGRIVKQIEAQLGGRYDHYQPAAWLLRDSSGFIAEIQPPARERFQTLIDRLNALL